MKKIVVILVVLAAVAGLTWLVWFKPAKHEEEEKPPDTEVAVRVGKITRTTLRAYVTAYGVVEPAPPGDQPAASARVAPAVPGVIAAVNGVEGRRVEKGAVLFQLDSRLAEVAADKARQAVAFAEKTVARQQQLLQAEGTSQKLVLEAEQVLSAARHDLAAAQAQQALLRVESPLAGTLTRVRVNPGEAVDLTTVLAEVVDLDRLVANANVPEAELARLKAGQRVEVLTSASAAPIGSTLVYVSPQVDAKTGTALVRAAMPARAGLYPGQFVTLRIVSEERQDRLAAPVQSVVKNQDGLTVIALVENGKATQKPVKAGRRDGELMEVEGDGLSEGMTVVMEGAYALPKATKVRVLNQETEKPKTEKTKTEKLETEK